MLELKRLTLSRVVANPAALDAVKFGAALIFRVAPDEMFVMGTVNSADITDDYAIITKEASLSGVWLEEINALHFLEHECAWEIPAERPVYAQGMVAHLPVKLYFEGARVLIMTAVPFAYDLAQRLGGFIHE